MEPVNVTKTIDSLYGVRNGQVYVPADGSERRLLVLDCETYAACSDVVVRDMATNVEFRIDAFKLAMVRYTLAHYITMTPETTPMSSIWIDPFELYMPQCPNSAGPLNAALQCSNMKATSPDYLGITRDVVEGTVTNEP